MKLSTACSVAVGIVSYGGMGYSNIDIQHNMEIAEAAKFYERRFANFDNLVSEVIRDRRSTTGCIWHWLRSENDQYDKFDLKGFADSGLAPKCIDDPPIYIMLANGLHSMIRSVFVTTLPRSMRSRYAGLVRAARNPNSMNALFPSDRDAQIHGRDVKLAFLRYHERKETLFDHMDFSEPTILSERLFAGAACGRTHLRALIQGLGSAAELRLFVMMYLAVGCLCLFVWSAITLPALERGSMALFHCLWSRSVGEYGICRKYTAYGFVIQSNDHTATSYDTMVFTRSQT